jgi:catechol 2,3-dioxygenase-like lactoylglutathione lyase family enzyme
VELLQYTGGSDVVLDPDNGFVGAAHVAIVVADIEATLAELRAHGVAAISDPIVTSAPMQGFKAVYVLDPDRVRVELVEAPAGVEPWVRD